VPTRSILASTTAEEKNARRIGGESNATSGADDRLQSVKIAQPARFEISFDRNESADLPATNLSAPLSANERE
jgi:hypothetical protein